MSINPKVSVIIPVWNPGEGISRCVASLRGQTLKDIEMIFVDDCGTDGAMDVVRAAAAEDPRIRIITNIENSGAGASRNAAIEMVQGEYVSFVDADDYVEDGFLEILYTKGKAEGLDIVKGSIVYEQLDGSVVSNAYNLNDVIGKGLLEQQPLFYLFTFQFASAVYHRKLFANPAVRFGMTPNDEDTTFLLKACHLSERFDLEESARYHYVRRETSAVNVMTPASLEGRVRALKDRMDYLADHVEPNPYATKSVVQKIKNYLPLQRYVCKMEGMEDAAAHFLSELRVLSKDYFGSDIDRVCDLTIIALVKYGVNLADYPFRRPWEKLPVGDYVDVIANWTVFLSSHPRYFKKFLRLRRRANGLRKKMEAEGFSSEELGIYDARIEALLGKASIVRMCFKSLLRRHPRQKAP